MFGAIAINLIIDKYGRRPSFMFGITSAVIGWALVAISSSIHVLYIGLFLAGIMPGCMCIGQIYAAETIVVNHLHLRNTFSTWSTIALAIGVILDAVLGRLVSYQTVALIAVVIALISLTSICIFIPESPQWLCQQGKIHRARLSEAQLNIHQPVLKDFDHNQTNIKDDKGLTWNHFKEGIQQLKRKDIFKPLIILIVWDMLVVFSGGLCIVAYQVDILNDYPLSNNASTDNVLVAYNLGIISAILGLVGVTLTSILVTYTGIKNLFNFSALGMAIGMIGLAISFNVSEEYKVTNFWSLTHTASVWLIIFFNNLGGSTVLSSVLGEMFPHDSKRWASLPSISFCGVGGILVKLHLYLYSNLGFILYFIYAFFNLLSIIFVRKFVPETVGKTQEEIGKYFLQ